MKKLFILLLMLPAMLMAQRKVAVYVTGSESLEPDVKEILASELANGISQARDFQAVERTADFARALENSQDNEQICTYGQRLGVDMVCVASVSSFRDSYYIKARLLDVRTMTVSASASEGSSLATIEDILRVSEHLAGQLFDRVAPVEEEYSRVGHCNKRNCDIIKIDNTGDKTIVTFKIMDAKGIRWSMYAATTIRDRATGNEYKLLATNGIYTDHSETYGIGVHEFTATFEKLPYTVKNIDIIEPKGWEWTDIELNNFGQVGLHIFYDETREKFGRMMKEQELMRRQEARVGTIVNVEDSYRSYLVTIHNDQYSDFLIQLEGVTIGKVEKRSTKTFRLAPEKYGLLKAIQIDYLISPQVFKFQIPPMKPTDEISFNILRP